MQKLVRSQRAFQVRVKICSSFRWIRNNSGTGVRHSVGLCMGLDWWPMVSLQLCRQVSNVQKNSVR